jgi:two-component system phosphate regulon sensor histidine kinase PhoR
MLIWIISSFVLLGVLTWLGASIFYLYRQKTFNELQKDFVNNFTHEFKTPLSVIMLAAESLKKNTVINNPERITTYAEMVQQQSQYLHGQIDRLLRYSFSENSELQVNKEQFDVNELISAAINNLQHLFQKKNATVAVEANAENTMITGDKDYLLIVFINVIENALKYSTEPRVLIETTNEGDLLKVSVKDNGVGIEEKYFGQIFKKFFRVPKGDIHSSKGFGIGLSFVKKIIDSHHGSIEVKSVPGIGSSFTISLHQA